jgi:flagellar biogenesis protein FliO
MRLLQGIDREFERETPVAASEMQGLAGWVLGLLQKDKRERGSRQKQLRVVEILPLGGKRQLMVVEYAGERFLVGGGLESVQTIVRLQDVESPSLAKSVDGPCR